ncbi:hypothetical protein BJV74DRAFT_953132 [Russula compacta]|nr:hypothetical protein BJV74DRAFT_953132 [Russula compacta]
MECLGIPEGVLRDYLAHRDGVLLANLILLCRHVLQTDHLWNNSAGSACDPFLDTPAAMSVYASSQSLLTSPPVPTHQRPAPKNLHVRRDAPRSSSIVLPFSPVRRRPLNPSTTPTNKSASSARCAILSHTTSTSKPGSLLESKFNL